jgi:HlyD family secretion protein
VRRYARVLIWGIVALLAAAGVALVLRPRPVPADVARIETRRIEVAVEAEAKTRIHDRYVVSAPVSGRLLRIGFDEGDRVTAGQAVASIDPLPYNANVDAALQKLRELQAQSAGVETFRPKEEALSQARSRVAESLAGAASAAARVLAADSAYQQADREASRQAALERQGYASKAAAEQSALAKTTRLRELQMAKTGAVAADAQVAVDRAIVDELTKKVRDPDYLRAVYGAQMDAIRAQLRTLEDQAHRTVATAPASGEVLRVLQKSEAYVGAGVPLLEIGSRRTLEIVADVLSQDAVTMHVGDPVDVLRGAGDAHPRAKVRLIEPSGYTKISALGIEEQRVNVIAEFVGPSVSLGDAYRLDVKITTWAGDVLAVPVSALVRCQADWCAFAVRDGRAVRRRLRIGHMGSEFAQILSGLDAGDAVILRPTEAVRDGTAIQARPSY